jgi:peroxiredoxin
MLNIGDKAPGMKLKGKRGEEVALSSLWREKPLVLVFLRHFG